MAGPKCLLIEIIAGSRSLGVNIPGNGKLFSLNNSELWGLVPKYVTEGKLSYREKSTAKNSHFIHKAIKSKSPVFWFSLYQIPWF